MEAATRTGEVSDSVPLSLDMPAHLAYWRGLVDGYKLGRADQDAVDDAQWRRTVRGLFAEEGHDSGRRDLDGRPLPSITAQIDSRRRFDRGPLGEYGHRKGWVA